MNKIILGFLFTIIKANRSKNVLQGGGLKVTEGIVKNTNIHHKKNRGQSTVEFLLTSILILGFAFLIIKVTLLYAYGSYVQYAVFMSSRAYYAGGLNKENQEERARNVLFQTIKKGVNNSGENRFGVVMGQGVGAGTPEGAIIGESEGHFVEGDRDFSWMEGVRYVFKSKLFILPLKVSSGLNIIELTSESWLGREVTDTECKKYLGKFGRVEIDNGC